MHHVYSTEGFVLESAGKGEANKLYYIFTEDLGLVTATAQGVRLLKSKLRFHLEPYSRTGISLVRGKDMWRITNAREVEPQKLSLQSKKACARILSLVRRLVQGEEKNEGLYVVLRDSFDFLKANDEAEKIHLAEIVTVFKVLQSLGYAHPLKDAEELSTRPLSEELLPVIAEKRAMLVMEINKSLKETQL
jgi:DNA repair protein RecO